MKPVLVVLTLATIAPALIRGQCPWSRDSQLVELQSSCVCNTNSGQDSLINALSVQCQSVNFPMLMSALRSYAADTILENLYISNR